jgi:ribosomal protein S12 methylthiotransferase accessory factor
MPGRYRPALDEAALRSRHSFAALVRPHVGLLERVNYLPLEIGAVELEVAATRLGNLTFALDHVSSPDGGDVRDAVIGGGSADVDPERSWVRAVVESAERYSTMAYSERDFVVASARELGSSAIDLTRIPRCSDAEYLDPRCPLHPPPLDEPIRWVRGLSLLDHEERLVPAIMTHLYLKPWPAERFWLPVSTGVAAHTRLPAALLAAVCEDVERDALALTWLLSRPLPRIADPLDRSPHLAALLGRVARSNVEHLAFDATTDCGVPTVLAVQISQGHPHCELLVSCATAVDPQEALGKTIREVSPARAVLATAPTPPPDVRDFTEITDGAAYYGRGGHHDDFAFLLSSTLETSDGEMAARTGLAPGAGEEQQLAFVLGRLESLGMDALAVDITADEVRDVGLWVVRVVVPELMPISFVHRARYLGTDRLRRQAGARDDEGTAVDDVVTTAPLPFA